MNKLIVVIVLALVLGGAVFTFRAQLEKIQAVEMPLARREERKNKDDAELKIVISEQSTLTLNGEATDLAGLKTKLATAKAAGKTTVSVKGAAREKFKEAIEVLDLVREAGFERVSIQPEVR